MQIVEIKWDKFSYQELFKIDWFYPYYLYLIVRGTNLIYIGLTYYTDFAYEINYNMKRCNINSLGLHFWLGEFKCEKSDFERISKKLVKDVESLLIFYHKPSHNISNINTYYGRSNLKIKNMGCPYLEKNVNSEKLNH